MSTTRDAVTAAALAGAAGGCRTFTGIAGLAAGAPPDATAQPDRTLASPTAKLVLAGLALAEWAGDKLPQTPSRLAAPGLAGRLAAAAASGLVVSRRERPVELAPVPGEEPGHVQLDERPSAGRDAACVAAALATAVGAAWVGVRWRAFASSRFGHDWPAAAIEDALALGLAAGAARIVG